MEKRRQMQIGSCSYPCCGRHVRLSALRIHPWVLGKGRGKGKVMKGECDLLFPSIGLSQRYVLLITPLSSAPFFPQYWAILNLPTIWSTNLLFPQCFEVSTPPTRKSFLYPKCSKAQDIDILTLRKKILNYEVTTVISNAHGLKMKTLVMCGSSSTVRKSQRRNPGFFHSVNFSGPLHFLCVKCSPNSLHNLHSECHGIEIISFTYKSHFFHLGHMIKASERSGRNSLQTRASISVHNILNSAEWGYFHASGVVTQLFLFQ